MGVAEWRVEVASCELSVGVRVDVLHLPIGVRAPSDLGGGGGAVTVLPENKYTMPESMCCTKRTQIAVNQKRSHFLRLMNVLSFQNYS